MTTLAARDFAASPLEITGALDFDERGDALSPRRLPSWTRTQINPMLDFMLRTPSGVRIRFTTSAHTVSLTVLTTHMAGRSGRGGCAFDLVCGDTVHTRRHHEGNQLHFDPTGQTAPRIEPGEIYDVVFDGLGNDSKSLSLWLPHNALVELHALAVEGGDIEPPEPFRLHWVHHGSSISHCMEADIPTGTWPVVAAHTAGVDVTNLGLGGQCHLDPFIARTIRDLNPDFISVKAGINIVNGDTMRERVFLPAAHGFLDTLREAHPATPILIISPIFCPSAEDHPGPTIPNTEGKFKIVERPPELLDGSLSLSRIRKLLSDLVVSRNDPHLAYLSGLELFNEHDAGDLPDDLHPNPAGYRRMGKRFADRVFGDGGILQSIR